MGALVRALGIALCAACATACARDTRDRPPGLTRSASMQQPKTSPSLGTSQTPRAAAPSEQPAAVARPRAGEEIAIAAGTLLAGSATGSADRNPAREADAAPVQLAPFTIDALPYPNDPGQAPRSGATQSEAEQLCAARGQRLCSELEWERACKGNADSAYPVAGALDRVACARDLRSCRSELGVYALGLLGREWTRSKALHGDWDPLRSAVVRGAPANAPRAAYRCAARDAAVPTSRSESLLFRCCRGADQQATYPRERELHAFEELALSPEQFRADLQRMAETQAVAEAFRPATKQALLQALTSAGRGAHSLAPWQATPALRWSPLPGEEIVVVSGDTAQGAMLIAYYPTNGGPRFAGSYLTKDEHVPLLVAYKHDVRDELLYSTCWGCGGEGGALRVDSTQRVRFVPR